METTLQQQLGIVKLEPVQSDLKHYSNGDCNVIEALKSPRINQVDTETLNESFRYVMMLVGIRARNLPDKTENIVLYAYLRKYFGMFTIQEFRIAFELAIAGELSLKDDEVKCFDNFSCEYMSRILKAYRKLSSSIIDFAERKQQPVKPLLPPADYKPAELVDTFYQEFLKGEFNLKFVSGMVYDTAFKDCNLEIGHNDLMKIIADAKEYILSDYTARLLTISQVREEARYKSVLQLKYEVQKMSIGVVCKNDDVNQYAKALCLQFWFCEQKKKGIKKIL
jgi:hypothetical protein